MVQMIFSVCKYMNQIATSYVNMHIFSVPDGQQPRYDDRPATQQRHDRNDVTTPAVFYKHAISIVNMHIFYVLDGQQPANDKSSLFYKTRLLL